MKIKFFKPMAAALTVAVGTCISMSAFAANVITTTDYTYGATGDPDVVVTTNITNATAGKQVAFLVYKGNDVGTNGENIVYIDQGTATGGNINFEFKAKQSALYASGAEATVKFGTDGDAIGAEFKFNESTNYIGNGTATVTSITNINLDSEDVATGDLSAIAKISGNVKEYGFKLVDSSGVAVKNAEGDDIIFRAYGSTKDSNGSVYAVVVKGYKANAGDHLVPYGVDAIGNPAQVQ